MKIKSEFLEIASGARSDDGAKLEPEEQPARLVQNVAGGAEVSHGGDATGGAIPLQVARVTTAGELAEQRARQCFNCRHWRNAAWQKLVGDAAHGRPDVSAEEIHGVNLMRSAIIENFFGDPDGEDGGLDPKEVDEKLLAMGVCGPLTEHERANDPAMGPKELVVTFPTSCCPAEIITPTQPHGFFVPRDAEAAANVGKDRDAVLIVAAGGPK